MTDALIRVTIDADKGHINLRVNAADKVLVLAAEKVLGQALPVVANTMTEDDYMIFWLGPDEFHLACDAGESKMVCDRLTAALGDKHVAVNDLSGGQIALRLRGGAVPEVLAKGCTLDLHPDVFTAGSCAQSSLGKANVLLGRRHADGQYHLIVRRSFSGYVVKWLTHAAEV